MNNRTHLLLLLLWLLIGTIIRLVDLASLPPWTDECATIVFSLGNSFHTVPLNQVIGSDVLLQPLQPTSEAGISAVVEHLFSESTHPPLYFALTHLWMKLFSPPQELASIWAARSLSAFFGVACIPAMFGFAYLVFPSRLAAQMAAAMMAVSPYAIFLARQTRHYTLAILLVIASVCCLYKAVETIKRRQILPIWLLLSWIVVNCLGIATHYFFALSLCAQGLVLLLQIWRQIKASIFTELKIYWWRIGVIAVGTLMGCLVWLPVLQGIYGSEPTNWVSDGNPHTDWFSPIGRLLIWIISILLLLPSAFTNLPLAIVIVSGVVSLLFLLWSLPYLFLGWRCQQQSPDNHLAMEILVEYVVGAIAIFLAITYGLGMDLTLAARFQFVFAPAIILLLGAALAGIWQNSQRSQLLVYQGNFTGVNKKSHSHREPRVKQAEDKSISWFTHQGWCTTLLDKYKLLPIVNGKVRVIIIYLMATVGGFTAAYNLGYLQNHRPDILAPIIQEFSEHPVLIATTHKHHGQTGRMMGLAWEFPSENWQFFLAHRDSKTKNYTNAIQMFHQQLTELPRPFDLWLVDFQSGIDLESQQCVPDHPKRKSAGEYRYRLYRCRATN
ncbi:MAG: glycosyltransferase family 39 protein [Nostocaceae cyanobacterium]|nr:glycosyltransferase family 39 protein [Nostocaceae cyanobacterium]